MSTSSTIAYLGFSGAGFGFRLAGVDVFELADSIALAAKLKELVASSQHEIIFVDEELAADQLEVIARYNRDPRPSIILLPNPVNPQNVAATNMQQLMVRAIGTDIFEQSKS